MHTPNELRKRLCQQWNNPVLRVERLLVSESWPVSLPIGKPSAKAFSGQPQRVMEHVHLWRQVDSGVVEWETINYRAGNGPVSMPLRWILNTPADWINAMADLQIRQEYRILKNITEQVASVFHPILIKHRALWRGRHPHEIISAARLACQLTPGCAKSQPLRLLSGLGVDTKFIENNVQLLTRLLDVLYSGEVSEQGLITFLDACDETNHWVMVVPLSSDLLVFKKSRVRTSELAETVLPASTVLVIENERCLHQLPELPDTIAVLGAGLDLQWLSGPALDDKKIGYWGDMDSWGMLMLARARSCRPGLHALLMNRALFDLCAPSNAVPEPVKVQEGIPVGLLDEEINFYQYLSTLPCGRLEQEFLPVEVVGQELTRWKKTLSKYACQ